MRATGQGVLRIERKQAQKLTDIAALFIEEAVIDPGTYDFRVEQDSLRSIKVVLRRLPDTGGAHEQFWRRFNFFLSELSEQAASRNEPGAVTLVSEIMELQAILCAQGLSNGTWLSAMRNRINYQHEYGVWYPYHPLTATKLVMAEIGNKKSSSIRRDFNSSRDPLIAFSAACQILASVNIDVARALARRPNAARFKRLWERLEAGG